MAILCHGLVGYERGCVGIDGVFVLSDMAGLASIWAFRIRILTMRCIVFTLTLALSHQETFAKPTVIPA